MFTIDSTIDIASPLASVRTAITTEVGYRAWSVQDADFDGSGVPVELEAHLRPL